MNRTESVSIGRKGFICDQDAYKVLQDYLMRSEKALLDDPDQKEILTDLELSMAGHITETSGDLVVDKATAEHVIARMGEVEGETQAADSATKAEASPESSRDDLSFADRLKGMIKKPLYKDHEREIADGVCAGIAKELDVDPVWVRLVFVGITLITQGFGIILYIVLSIIMKEESTYKKKTAGEVVDNIREKLTKTANNARPYERALRKLIVGIIIVIWTILRVFVCLVLVVASIAWASYLFFMLNTPDQVAIFNGRPGWLEFVTVFSGGLVLLIPLFELLVAMFKPKVGRSRMSLALWSIWALSLIAFVAGAINVYPKVENYLKTEQPKNDFVYLQMVGDEIASLCISPLGTCSDDLQLLTYEQICGSRYMTIYDMDDRPEWQSRQWMPVFESFAYPVSQEVYCKRVTDILDANGSGNRIMFARQVLNDRAYVSNYEIWQLEYMTNR